MINKRFNLAIVKLGSFVIFEKEGHNFLGRVQLVNSDQISVFAVNLGTNLGSCLTLLASGPCKFKEVITNDTWTGVHPIEFSFSVDHFKKGSFIVFTPNDLFHKDLQMCGKILEVHRDYLRIQAYNSVTDQKEEICISPELAQIHAVF